MQELEGRIISHYRLQKQTEKEEFAESYLATDRPTGQVVVIKLLPHNENAERLEPAIKALSELKHTHVLPILEYGQHDSGYYIATPHIEYETLEQRLSHGPLSLEEAGERLEQLADALQFVRSHGITHCNIKPSNIVLKDGHHIYLTIESLTPQDDQSQIRPDDGVDAPEDIAPAPGGGQTTPADDAYALGTLLCQMLTGGDAPSQVPGSSDVLDKQIVNTLQLPTALSVPGALEEVMRRSLAIDPQKRFQTPREFAQAYQKALVRSSTVPVSASTRTQNPPRLQGLPQKARDMWLLSRLRDTQLLKKLKDVQFIKKVRETQLLKRLGETQLRMGVIVFAVITLLLSVLLIGVSLVRAGSQTALQNRPVPTAAPPKVSPPTKNGGDDAQVYHTVQVIVPTYPTDPAQERAYPAMQAYPTAQAKMQVYPTAQAKMQAYPTVQAKTKGYPKTQATVKPYPTEQVIVQVTVPSYPTVQATMRPQPTMVQAKPTEPAKMQPTTPADPGGKKPGPAKGNNAEDS